MTSEDGEMWNALKKQRQDKRASNRDNSADMLKQAGIPFSSNNGGAHLIVEGRDGYIDFWPGTGRWISRNVTRGFGVRNLLEHVK